MIACLFYTSRSSVSPSFFISSFSAPNQLISNSTNQLKLNKSTATTTKLASELMNKYNSRSKALDTHAHIHLKLIESKDPIQSPSRTRHAMGTISHASARLSLAEPDALDWPLIGRASGPVRAARGRGQHCAGALIDRHGLSVRRDAPIGRLSLPSFCCDFSVCTGVCVCVWVCGCVGFLCCCYGQSLLT